MNLLKTFLLDKEYFKAIDQIEELLKEKNIDSDSIFHKFTFDNSFSFEEAKIWCREKYFNVVEGSEKDGTSSVIVLDESEFVSETFKDIEIESGVIARVGLLKSDVLGEASACYLSLRNSEEMNIKLSEDAPHIIELATVVTGYHASYGEVKITQEMLRSFVRNFNESVVGVDLMIDYDHSQAEAAGWVKSVFLSADGNTVYGEVRWTPQGAKTLGDRAFRYFSPEFTENYVHPHTGIAHGPTLLGGGLVNRPFLKMDAIIAFNNKEEGVVMDTIKLADHEAKVSVLSEKIKSLELSEETAKKLISSQKEEVKTLSEKIAQMEKDAKEAETKAKHEKMFSEGTISKAQLDALNEGKDIYEVLSLNEKMNVSASGSSEGSSSITLSDDELAACKKFGMTPEEYVKYNS